jgi:hypothetical protein
MNRIGILKFSSYSIMLGEGHFAKTKKDIRELVRDFRIQFFQMSVTYAREGLVHKSSTGIGQPEFDNEGRICYTLIGN